ncbi:hypothetical protein SHY80_02780 [Streptococcus suis]|nr:hypothetical protein [Streptococcus suis]MDX4991526.1 hypothetical protein [Streptococcus suis]
MKKLTKITLLSTALLTILVGCGGKSSEKTTASSETVETTQSSSSVEKVQAETVSFFAPGQYKEGTDIKPGSYYIVLTDLEHSSSDTEKNAYVSVYVKDSKGETKFSEGFIREIGKPYRITIEEGDILAFGDNYSPSGWNVSFFTDEDFKEYQSSEKK